MTIYDEFAELAIELINEFTPSGPNAKWVKLADNVAPDPNKPWDANQSQATQYDVRIVFLPESISNREFIRYLKGTEAATGNITGIMYPHSEFTPNQKDTVLRGDEEYVVTAIDPIQPETKVIAYFLEFST